MKFSSFFVKIAFPSKIACKWRLKTHSFLIQHSYLVLLLLYGIVQGCHARTLLSEQARVDLVAKATYTLDCVHNKVKVVFLNGEEQVLFKLRRPVRGWL